MKKLLCLFIAVAIMFGLVACGGGGNQEHPETAQDSSAAQFEESEPTGNQEEQEGPQEATEDGALKSGTYTLPCGVEIQFFDEVRNDVTGRWRRAATSDSAVPADYALEYYHEMFVSDDEIHSIWNATLGTTTQVSVAFGILYVDTYEYVKGEEHDAKIMFSGEHLDSRMIDIETGELIEA